MRRWHAAYVFNMATRVVPEVPDLTKKTQQILKKYLISQRSLLLAPSDVS